MSIIQFCKQETQDREQYARQLGDLVESDETRMIFGNLFLQIAASEPPENETPHESLLRRMLGPKEMDDKAPAMFCAKSLDLLRQKAHYEKIHAAARKIAKDVNQGNNLERFFQKGKPVDYQAFRDSDPVRLLLGSFFLKLAKSAPPKAAAPYSELLEKLVGDSNPPGIEQLKILMDNFDKFRNYNKIDDPQGLAMARAMLGSESTQLVLGNMFINVAELSAEDDPAPYARLLDRLAGDARPNNLGQAKSVANILDHGRNAFLQRKNAAAGSEMQS